MSDPSVEQTPTSPVGPVPTSEIKSAVEIAGSHHLAPKANQVAPGDKLVAIIGGTGAQGLPTIKHLLKPQADGSPSPYRCRVLTRNVNHPRALHLATIPGVELLEGTFTDMEAVTKLFDGAEYAFVNTDGFTVGQAAEGLAAFQIYETARACETMKHFIWSNLDYSLRKGNWHPRYHCDYFNTKGRFADFLSSQSNAKPGEGFMWTVYTNGPYMDMLGVLFTPMHIKEDGTRIFINPIGREGRVPFIALDDLGWWSRWIFDNPEESTGRHVEIASHPAGFEEVCETFTKVTGHKAEYVVCGMDEYFTLYDNPDAPVGSALEWGSPSWMHSIKGFLSQWRDNTIKRDMKWISERHPDHWTLENWMRATNYQGKADVHVLKNILDQRSPTARNPEKIRKFLGDRA